MVPRKWTTPWNRFFRFLKLLHLIVRVRQWREFFFSFLFAYSWKTIKNVVFWPALFSSNIIFYYSLFIFFFNYEIRKRNRFHWLLRQLNWVFFNRFNQRINSFPNMHIKAGTIPQKNYINNCELPTNIEIPFSNEYTMCGPKRSRDG